MRWRDIDSDDRDRVADLAERQLSPAEWDAYVNAPASEEERRDVQDLLAWFLRRYPTPEARLGYARRAYLRWTSRTSR